jgi:hypothetical protein
LIWIQTRPIEQFMIKKNLLLNLIGKASSVLIEKGMKDLIYVCLRIKSPSIVVLDDKKSLYKFL